MQNGNFMVSKAMIDGMYIIRLVISNPITTSSSTILSMRSSAREKSKRNCHTNEEVPLSYPPFAKAWKLQNLCGQHYMGTLELNGNIVDFHGFELPIWYTSITEEHLACRRDSGVFDVSHMGVFGSLVMA